MIQVRIAAEADIPRLLELYRQLAISTPSAEEEDNPSADRYREAFDRIRRQAGHELLVTEEDGRVTGTMTIIVIPTLAHNGRPWAVIEHMVVEERRRRTGTGRLLIEHGLRKAMEAGCYKVQLASTNSRKEAHAFYRSMGFRASAKGFRLYF